MSEASGSQPVSKAARWAGYVFSTLPALMLVFGRAVGPPERVVSKTNPKNLA